MKHLTTNDIQLPAALPVGISIEIFRACVQYEQSARPFAVNDGAHADTGFPLMKI